MGRCRRMKLNGVGKTQIKSKNGRYSIAQIGALHPAALVKDNRNLVRGGLMAGRARPGAPIHGLIQAILSPFNLQSTSVTSLGAPEQPS